MVNLASLDGTVLAHVEAIRTAIAGEMAVLERQRQDLAEERRRLDDERRLFEVEKRALRDRVARGQGMVCPMKGDVVELNVGGTHFTTTLPTLRADPASNLAAMFDTPSNIPLDPDGRFFLDFSGTAFEYVLKHLRGDKFFVKKGDPIVAEVYSLAHRLNLQSFIRTIERVLRSLKGADQQPQQQQPQQQRQASPPPQPPQQNQGWPSPQAAPQALQLVHAEDMGPHPGRGASFAGTEMPVKAAPVQASPEPYSPPRGMSQGQQQQQAQPASATMRAMGAGSASPARTSPVARRYDEVSGMIDASGALESDPLQRALRRQQAKLHAQLSVIALEQVKQDETSSRAASSWEKHWQAMGP